MSISAPVEIGRLFRLVLAALATVAFCPASQFARADNIDEQLLKQAPALLDYLHQHGYKNVGVLKFLVQKGTQKPSYNVGDMNLNMARRLENALVLLSGPQQPLGVIHDAGQAAADRHAHLSLQDEADRRQLFEFSYSLAGDRTKVSADCFLTGIVKVTPDMRKTSVTVQAFARSAPNLAEVLSFSVPTDRSILADLGQSFLVSKRALAKGIDGDQLAEDSAKQADQTGQPPAPPDKGPSARQDLLVDFKILYDDLPQEIGPDPSNPGQERVQPPRPGQKVVFVIKNLSSQQVGVVLKVNGLNTLLEQEDETAACAKWILDPGAEYRIPGFYLDHAGSRVVAPFKILADNDPALEQLSLKSPGLIELAGFTSGGPDDLKPNLRGLSKRDLTVNPPKSLADLQAKLMDKAHLKRNKRGLIVKDADSPSAPAGLKEVPFPNPNLLQCRTIRYEEAGPAKGNPPGQGGSDLPPPDAKPDLPDLKPLPVR